MADTSNQKCFVHHESCKNLPGSYKYRRKNYCIIHAPNPEKAETFKREIQKKLAAQDYNFQSWYFSCDVEFLGPRHSKSFIFMDATFTGRVTFSGIFEEELDFRHALFEKGSRLTFRYAQLESGLDLRHATIQGYVRFEGDESMEAVDGELIDRLNLVFKGEEAWLDLQNTIIDKAEQIIFHTTRLEPNWFVNVDCRKFVFTDCRWMKADGKPLDALDEVDKVYMKNGVTFPPNPNALLTQTCLQLAENYQTNKDAETSSCSGDSLTNRSA